MRFAFFAAAAADLPVSPLPPSAPSSTALAARSYSTDRMSSAESRRVAFISLCRRFCVLRSSFLSAARSAIRASRRSLSCWISLLRVLRLPMPSAAPPPSLSPTPPQAESSEAAAGEWLCGFPSSAPPP